MAQLHQRFRTISGRRLGVRHSHTAHALTIAIAISTVPLETAQSQEQYICELAKVTGFAYDEKSKAWEIARFSAGDRYIISKPSVQWQITKLGDTHSSVDCDEFNEYGFLEECFGLLHAMFNKNTNLFMVIHPYGYVVSNAPFGETRLTPYMGIGKCSPF